MESEHNLTWVQSIQQHYYGSRYFLNDFLSQFECCSCETITQLVYYQLQQQKKNANDKNEALKITKFSVSRVVIVSWFPLLLSYIICAIDEKPYQLQKMKIFFVSFSLSILLLCTFRLNRWHTLHTLIPFIFYSQYGAASSDFSNDINYW